MILPLCAVESLRLGSGVEMPLAAPSGCRSSIILHRNESIIIVAGQEDDTRWRIWRTQDARRKAGAAVLIGTIHNSAQSSIIIPHKCIKTA